MFRHHTQTWLYVLSVMVIVFCAVIFFSPNAFAAECTEGFCPLADVEGSRLEGLYSGPEGDLAVFFGRLFYFALSIGAILAILRIAWGGYLYMTTDLWSSKERAKEVLRETTLGLFLLLAVWLILHQINPKILELNIKIEALPSQNQGGANPAGGSNISQGPGGAGLITFSTPERRPQPQPNTICGSDAEFGAGGTGLGDWVCGYKSVSGCLSVNLRECGRY